MSQAEQGTTAPVSGAATGSLRDLSRRQMFTGAACVGLALGATSAASVTLAAPMPPRPKMHSVVERADEARAASNSRFWKAHREYQKVMTEYLADDDRWRVEKWAERIEAAEHKMLLIGVSSAGAIRAKLMVTDDPINYPLPGAAKNLLQMVLFDLDRISMLEMTGLAYSGELI